MSFFSHPFKLKLKTWIGCSLLAWIVAGFTPLFSGERPHIKKESSPFEMKLTQYLEKLEKGLAHSLAKVEKEIKSGWDTAIVLLKKEQENQPKREILKSTLYDLEKAISLSQQIWDKTLSEGRTGLEGLYQEEMEGTLQLNSESAGKLKGKIQIIFGEMNKNFEIKVQKMENRWKALKSRIKVTHLNHFGNFITDSNGKTRMELEKLANSFTQKNSRRDIGGPPTLKRGRELIKGGDLAGGILILLELLKENPHHLDAHWTLAVAYFRLAEFAKSRDHLTPFLEIFPEEAGAEKLNQSLKQKGF